jgi:sigma-B regulation protein RsbU (phosphoserine phosphatase)
VLELADKVTMKRDLEIAREIQRWLVPEAPPQVAGLDIAFTTRPANTVAGDYYDAFFRDEGHTKLLLVVADVAGKSMPAALLMATFQASLHSSAYDGNGLDELAAHLNQFACTRSRGGERFTTAFLGELDVATRTLTYVNAGHNAPVLRHVSGTVERLGTGGLPFGIDAAGRYQPGFAKLERNDLLLIFTDGLVEAVNESGEEYGEERMLYMLQTVPGESSSETIRHLLQNVEGFVRRARQHDDITLLALHAV